MILSISTHIYELLHSDAQVMALTEGRIYPLGTKDAVPFPFIAYERDNVQPNYDKAQRSYTNTSVTVYCVADTHSVSLALAEAVVSALECKDVAYDGYTVEGGRVTGAAEGYVDGAFVQQVSFEFLIIDTQ